jgi:predicted alpha/beta hydrolase family esterase
LSQSHFEMSAPSTASSDHSPSQQRISKAILIPGNGCGADSLDDCMWYGWLAEQLRTELGIPIVTPGFPDPLYAHESVWKSFCVDELGLDEHTLVIGHSSGAACALRLMEERRFAGCVLVSAYDTDFGDAIERESGYFNRPFQYHKMAANVPWIAQFHSKDDHLVDVACARRVASELRRACEKPNDGDNSEQRRPSPTSFTYVELEDLGHFQEDEVPMISDAIASWVRRQRQQRA